MEKGHFDKKGLAKIDVIVFRRENRIIITGKRCPIEPLDKIPMPARDILKIEESAHMFTSRGCPDNCTFCASCRFWDKVRFFSADYVVDEIKLLVSRYKVKKIAFFDDLFIANKARIERILNLLKEEGIIGKVGSNLKGEIFEDRSNKYTP
jgi:anaerobic magnesium-protoporphyrin IX monomethyl ester cyclase